MTSTTNLLVVRDRGNFVLDIGWKMELIRETEARLPSLRGLQMMLASRFVP